MIDFINFLILLTWSFFKLFFSIMMCCITILVLRPLLQEVSKIISDFWKNTCWAWDEIRAMENSEYGEDFIEFWNEETKTFEVKKK